MAIRRILRYPDPFLRRTVPLLDVKAELLGAGGEEASSPPMFSAWDDVEETLLRVDGGAALAANQVGLPGRYFVTNQLMTTSAGIQGDACAMLIPPVVVNPRVVEHSALSRVDGEGCLSFPGIVVAVRRWVDVLVEYETMLGWGNPGSPWTHARGLHRLTNFWARLFQHEIDHLDGRLIVDHLPPGRRHDVLRMMRGR